MSNQPGNNQNILQLISQCIDEGDLTLFRQLLASHPECLRNEHGAPRWMWSAAAQGKIPFLEALVALGLDVNESSLPHHLRNDNPEGPIWEAATHGRTDTVLWFLDHGAKINFVINGRSFCNTLVAAATAGHLEVVKILVEHGADFHATKDGVNAVTQADLYGKREVREYLRSLGAKDVREITPPDYIEGHKLFLHALTTRHGPLAEWSEQIFADPNVTLRVIPANEKCRGHTVFTLGLSDRNYQGEYNRFKTTELRLTLPSEWPDPKVCMHDSHRCWPFEWLKRIAGEFLASGLFPSPPITFMNGDPPGLPLADGTKLCGWLCLEDYGQSIELPDFRIIDIHDLIPIYAEEKSLVQRHDTWELNRRFCLRNMPMNVIDPKRSNLAVDDSDLQ